MTDTTTQAIVAAGFTAAVFVLHLREIPAEAELTAAGLVAAAAIGGVAVGYSYAQEATDDVAEVRDMVARIREDQKRGARQVEVLDQPEIDDEKN